MDETLPLASWAVWGWGRGGGSTKRGLPGTRPAFLRHPLSTPVCVEGKVMNAAEVPAGRELTVEGTGVGGGGEQGLTRQLLQHRVMKARSGGLRGNSGRAANTGWKGSEGQPEETALKLETRRKRV